ncbi:MAG: NAD(P)-binding protein [Candidatus Caldarchaeales archaeon]
MAGRTVIGAGLAGLSLAKELLERGIDARVIETRRRLGGISATDPEAMSIVDEVSREVRVETERTAVRVRGELVAVSSDGVEGLRGCVVATGFRVLTPAELGIFGDRPSGVYPYHAVLDLLTEGLVPGRHVALYGLNRYSVLLASKLLEHVIGVVVVDPSGPSKDDPELRVPDEVTVLRGRVERIRGRGRLSSVYVNGEALGVDALVIAMFEPWNPFPEFPAVGHAAIDVYDPKVLMEASELLADRLSCGCGRTVKVSVRGNLKVFPETLCGCLRRLLVMGRRGATATIEGRRYELKEGYAVIGVPGDAELVEVVAG